MENLLLIFIYFCFGRSSRIYAARDGVLTSRVSDEVAILLAVCISTSSSGSLLKPLMIEVRRIALLIVSFLFRFAKAGGGESASYS